MAKKPQTEAKAKGLVKNVGDYKGRTLNLTKKQVAKSGVKGAQRAASAKGTSISDTKFVKGKGVMAGGKLFTGNVDLGGGNIAVYVRGKRVRAKDTKGTSRRNPPADSKQDKKVVTDTKTKSWMTGRGPAAPGQYQAGRGTLSRPSRLDRGRVLQKQRNPIAGEYFDEKTGKWVRS